MEVAGWFVGPIMKKIIEACSDYLKDQLRWQTGMKEELERLRENHRNIELVVADAKKAQISDPALNKWIWQLRDAIDEANDVLDEFEYMKHQEQLSKNIGETKESTAFSQNVKLQFERTSKIVKRAFNVDSNLNSLEEVVKKLGKVSAEVSTSTFLRLLDSAKQEQKEQEVDFYKTRENLVQKHDLIGLRKEKQLVMQWLRKPSNDPGKTWYKNISLLSVVGHGGMGKTTLLQHVYNDKITKDFELKMWVCVSNNFDVKKVIADMLECLKNERPRLETLDALQNSLRTEIMSKKFLLILDDIWEEEEENWHISKWEKLLAPLAYGKMDSRILVTSRMDSVALTFVKVIKKKEEIVKLEGLEESIKNNLIGRRREKEFVMEWLRNPSNEHQGTDLYRNISLLSIVGHGGMGKTTLLQHVYKDEITKEFDLKMWVCVSNNFDVKKVIADMLECLKKERPRFETLWELQEGLKEEVMSKKFLLVLDDIWEEEDNWKWEKLLSPLAHGNIDSRILVTTRMDSVAMLIEKVITKKVEIFRLEGLEEDECLLLLKSYAFADVENPPENLRDIAGEMVKKLLGSPLAAKVIGGILRDKLDESHWRKVLESNLLDDNYIHSILRPSYIFLPNPLQNCFAFCCKFPQYHLFNRDDLLQMWISLGFIQPPQGMTMEDMGRRYFDVLLKKSLFDKVKYDCIVRDDYKMHDLIHESASKFFAQECVDALDDERSFLEISETIRHLSVLNAKPYILKKIEKFKHLHSLFLFYKASEEDIYSALINIFKTLRSLRLLYLYAPDLKNIPEEIGNLIHLRYLKIVGYNLTMLPRSLSNLYHLQCIIYDSPGGSQPYRDEFLPDISNLTNLRHINLPFSREGEN